MTNSCVHEEVIDAKGLGTCKKCGQQRQYNQENQMLAPVIVKEGKFGGDGEHPVVVTADQVKKVEINSKKDLKRRKKKRKTPERIVRRILELFDAHTPQNEIISILKSQNNFDITSAGICGILNRERPKRERHSHQGSRKEIHGKLTEEALSRIQTLIKRYDKSREESALTARILTAWVAVYKDLAGQELPEEIRAQIVMRIGEVEVGIRRMNDKRRGKHCAKNNRP